jgi:hypothetical protein
MANLWPQCSPGYAGWQGGGFRDKDRFENYLHRQVCAGNLSLAEAQFQIGTDWFQYWVAAGQVNAMNTQLVLAAPRSPWQRAYVKRVIGTIRR